MNGNTIHESDAAWYLGMLCQVHVQYKAYLLWSAVYADPVAKEAIFWLIVLGTEIRDEERGGHAPPHHV